MLTEINPSRCDIDLHTLSSLIISGIAPLTQNICTRWSQFSASCLR